MFLPKLLMSKFKTRAHKNCSRLSGAIFLICFYCLFLLLVTAHYLAESITVALRGKQDETAIIVGRHV